MAAIRGSSSSVWNESWKEAGLVSFRVLGKHLYLSQIFTHHQQLKRVLVLF